MTRYTGQRDAARTAFKGDSASGDLTGSYAGAAKRTPREEGGSAFPYASTGYGGTMGMTLRDYFAAKAPPPPKWWMDSYAKDAQSLDEYADTLVMWHYSFADAMLKAREAA